MKRVLIVTMLISLAGTGVTRAEEPTSADTLVWCGLDYSMVKMIGTGDFRQPEKIFPAMLAEWNGLFMKEMLPDLEAMTKSVRTSIKAVHASNEKAGPLQIEREDGTRAEMVTPTHITDKHIAAAVKGYDIKYKQGLGLVFLMDRLVKMQQTGCLYVVFFDVDSRKVIRSERVCAEARGYGFRNYWFNPIKETVEKLPAMYRKAKASSKS